MSLLATHPLPAVPFAGSLRIETTPPANPRFTLEDIHDASAAIRRRYEGDDILCAAFVEGVLSEQPSRSRAREAVKLFCARHGIDGERLLSALETALASRTRRETAAIPNRFHAYTHDAEGNLVRLG